MELLNHIELPSAIVRGHAQWPEIKLMSARSMVIEGTFDSSARRVTDKRVRLIDPCKLTIAYLGSRTKGVRCLWATASIGSISDSDVTSA